MSAAMRSASAICCGAPLADADVVHLALTDQIVERAQRLFERRLDVEAMGLVQVEVICAQPLQRGVATLDDVLAGEPAIVAAWPVGQNTLVANSYDSRRTPASASPSTASARV